MSRREDLQALWGGMMLIIMFACILAALVMSFDWGGPILSERNPNGTIDYWYLFDGAGR